MGHEPKLIHEVAGRRPMEAALLASLIHASPAVLYSCKVSQDYGTIAVTENARRVLGYSPEDFISDPSLWAMRVHPDDSARVFEEMPHLFRDGEQVIEYRFRRADGNYIWLRDYMRIQCADDGRPASILGCWIEIGASDRGTFISEIVGEAALTKTTTTAGGKRYANQT